MSKSEIYEKMQGILSKQLGIDRALINEDSLIGSDLGADSLDTAEIAMMIKDEFGYDLSASDISNIKVVRDICGILDTYYTQKHEPQSKFTK